MKDNIPVPPEIDDLEEIKQLIGIDTENADESAYSLDDILDEFKPVGMMNAGTDSKKIRAALKENPVLSAQKKTSAELKGARTPIIQEISLKNTKTERKPDDGRNEPKSSVNAMAGDDIQRQIAMQVETVLSKKQQEGGEKGADIPRAVSNKSAVKLQDEFDDDRTTLIQDNEPKPIGKKPKASVLQREADLSEPDTGGPFRISDDLRIFKGMAPADVMTKAKNAVHYYSWRCVATLLLSLLAGYITMAPTYSWPLPSFISYINLPYIYLFLLSALLIIAMLIAISMISDGLRHIFRLQFKAETLIAFSAFVCLFHTVSIILFPAWGGFLPYTSISILVIFFGLLTRCLRYRAVRCTCRSLSLSGKQIVIRGVKGQAKHIKTVYKTEPHSLGVDLMEMLLEEDASERVMRFYVPLVMVLAVVFAVIASFGTGKGERFLWSLSAILSVSMPTGILFSFAFPFGITVGRLSGSGVSIAGYRGTCDLAGVSAAVVNERDMFPTKLVVANNLKVYTGFTPDKVTICMLSVLKASGSGLFDALAMTLPHVPSNLPIAENFEFYETGGVGAYVNGDKVMVGTANFILRMGVRIAEGLNVKNNVFIAVNSQFAGSFSIKYDAQPSVRRALTYLVKRKIVPVLAVRDFNITPQLVETKFKLNPECFGYPDLEERIAYSGLKDSTKDDACAAMAMDNMVGYAELISAGKRIHSGFKLNMLFGGISAGIGIPLVFYLLFTGAAVSVVPFNVFYYLVLWFLPVLVASAGANRR